MCVQSPLCTCDNRSRDRAGPRRPIASFDPCCGNPRMLRNSIAGMVNGPERTHGHNDRPSEPRFKQARITSPSTCRWVWPGAIARTPAQNPSAVIAAASRSKASSAGLFTHRTSSRIGNASFTSRSFHFRRTRRPTCPLFGLRYQYKAPAWGYSFGVHPRMQQMCPTARRGRSAELFRWPRRVPQTRH
jgi:hypothetical protein